MNVRITVFYGIKRLLVNRVREDFQADKIKSNSSCEFLAPRHSRP
jgi:hypothetical protein